MENITVSAGFKIAILNLEFEQAENGLRLEENLYVVFESLKPANLLRGTFYNIETSPNLIYNVICGAFGASASIIKKLFGSILQFGVTTIVAQHPDSIKSIGQYIFQRILRKRK